MEKPAWSDPDKERKVDSMFGTIVVGLALMVVVASIIIRMRRDKKSGRGICGGDCCKCKGCH